MKQIYSKMLLLLLMVLVGNCAWAQKSVKFTFKTDKDINYVKEGVSGGSTTDGECIVSKSGVTLSGTNAYTTATKTLNVYAKSTLTITAPGNIIRLDLAYNGKVYPFDEAVGSGQKGVKFATSGENLASYYPETPSPSITLTNPNGGKTELLFINVVYEGGEIINVTGISLNKTWIELTEGDTYTLTAAVTPEDATNDKVLWTSADDDIVSVNNGIITALKSGSTYITATTVDGGHEAYCQVSVKKFAMPNHVKFVFAPNGTDNDNSNSWSTSSELDAVFSEGYEYISKLNKVDKVYPARNSLGNGVKFGTTKAAGTISFDLKGAVKARYVVVTAALYGDTEGQQGFTINGVDVTMPNKPNKVYCEYGIKLDGSDLTTITLSQKEQKEGRIYVESIDVYATSYPSFFKQAIKLSAKSDGVYYGTFSDEQVTFFPRETVTVSTASVNEKSKLILNPVEDGLMEINGTNINGSLINSNNGIIITSPESIVNYFTTNAFVLDDCEDNMLRPSSAEMTGDFRFYKLAYGDFASKTGLGFYYGAENGAAFESKAGLAYLAVPTASAGAKAYTFGETTSVSMPTVSTDAKVIYNLNGQRLSSLQKGINLVDGKKILVK